MEDIRFNKQEIIRFFTFSEEERQQYDFFPKNLREKKEEDMNSEEQKEYFKYKEIVNDIRKKEIRITEIEKFLKRLITIPRKNYNFFLEDLKERYKEAPFITEIFRTSSNPDEEKKPEYSYSVKSALTLGALINTYDNECFSFLRKSVSDNFENNEKWVCKSEKLISESERWCNEMKESVHNMVAELESGDLYQRGNKDYIVYKTTPEKLSPSLVYNFLWLLANVENTVNLKKATLKRLAWIYDKIDNSSSNQYDLKYILSKTRLIQKEILKKEEQKR